MSNVTYIFNKKLEQKQIMRQNVLASASNLNDRSQLKPILLRLAAAIKMTIKKMQGEK